MSAVVEIPADPVTEETPETTPEPSAEPADTTPDEDETEPEGDEDDDGDPVTDYPEEEEEDSAAPKKKKRGKLKLEYIKLPNGTKIVAAPPPPRCKATGKRFEQDGPGFIAYWKSLEEIPGLSDRLVCYLYRTWPILRKPEKPDRGRIVTNIDKLSEACDLEQILIKHGAGDYHLKLNDTGPRPSKQLCMANVVGLWRDLSTHPPQLNMELLDRDDPANKRYLQWLRSRGEISGNFGEEEGEEVAVIQDVLQQNKELTDKVVDMAAAAARREDKPAPIPIAPRPSVEERGIDRILETQAQAFAKTFDQATAVFAKQADPVETFTKMAAAIAPLMRPAPAEDSGGTKLVMEMMSTMMRQNQEHSAQMLGIVQKQLESVQAELAASRQREAAREAAREQTAAAQPNPTDPMNVLDKLIGMKEKLDGLTEAAPAGKATWLDAAKEIIAGVAPTVTAAVQAYAATEMAKAGVKPGAVIQQQPAAVGAVPPIIGAGSGTEGDQTNMAQMVYARLAMYAQPLLTKYNQGESGADFAGWMAEGNAQDFYLIKHLGKDNLLNLISQYPPIWDAVQLTRDRFGKFIDEFLNYDPSAPLEGEEAE